MLEPRPKGRFHPEAAVVAIVTVSLFVPADANVHVASEGSTPQLKFSVWLKPPRGVIVKVVEPLCPGALMLTVVGLAETVKSCTFRVCAGEEVDAARFASPG